jgi:diadenosine tetraphosphate (Ap4A) HIT family hydrolase
LPGYCVLLPHKKVLSLNDLSLKERAQFLMDMSFVGDAIIRRCHPLRINYEILGNGRDSFLHAHLFPKYIWEPEEKRKNPVWEYAESNWHDADKQYQIDKHSHLKNEIGEYLKRVYD